MIGGLMIRGFSPRTNEGNDATDNVRGDEEDILWALFDFDLWLVVLCDLKDY